MSGRTMPLPNYAGASALLGLAYELFQGKAITTRYIREEYGVPRATALRYLRLLETSIPGVVAEGGKNRGDTITLRMRRGPKFIPLHGSPAL